MEPRLSFEQWKAILKMYWRTENVVKDRRQWRCEYRTEPLMRLTIARFRDEIETHGTVCDVHKGRSGRPRTSRLLSSAVVLYRFEHSPQKSTKQCAHEPGVSRTNICRIINPLLPDGTYKYQKTLKYI